jgi:drug/metabolite transporter (DMT)-like permease
MLAFGAVYLFWGATFLALRYAVADVPPLLTIALRCAGGAVLLYAWVLWRGERARASSAEWRTAAVAGALLFVGCHALLAWAEQRVTSGQAALVATGIPLWMVLLTALRDRRRPTARVLAGIALGTAGVAVLASGGSEVWSGGRLELAALVFGTFTWAAGSLVGRNGPRPTSVAHATAMQLAAGALWLIVGSAAVGELARWTPGAITARALWALAFLIVCGTALGFAAYSWLLRVTSPAAASSYAFVNPVVALSLGWVVGDDRVTTRTLVAAGLVVAAVGLTRHSPAAGAGAAGAVRRPSSARNDAARGKRPHRVERGAGAEFLQHLRSLLEATAGR